MVIRGKRESLAYTAGIFDGEGYITILLLNTYKPKGKTHQLSVGMTITDRATVAELQREWGGTLVTDPRYYPNRKVLYMWRATGPTAVVFLKAIRPYLRIKHHQADIAFEFQTLKSVRWGRGKIDQVNLSRRDDLCMAIRTLNASRFPRPQRLSEGAPSLTDEAIVQA